LGGEAFSEVLLAGELSLDVLSDFLSSPDPEAEEEAESDSDLSPLLAFAA
jgi:hypothetical protein